MDNENKSNQTSGFDGSQYPNNNNKDNNMDNNLNSSQPNYDYNYSASSYNNYGSANQANVYPTPTLEETMPKKKRKGFGLFKLTAAAVAFGLIAGVTFQGYYFVRQQIAGETRSNDKVNIIQIAEVLQEPEGGDIIVPAGIASNNVITDVSGVVENVMPSIVAINSSATTTNYDFFGREYIEPMEGSGSGIIISQNGSEILIVTNNHVIEGAQTVEIVFTDNTTATAIVKGAEANADLAVLSVDLDKLSKETVAAIKVATLGNSDNVKAGEMAIAIGNALGYGQSVTVGYISAVNREVTIADKTMTLLQTDAAINPGNSGGALINTAGQLIGINSVKYASEAVEGMGYAIPISSALPMINELMSREIVADYEKGYLGIDSSTAQNVTELYAERFNMPIGVYINDVVEGSPADAAGLMQGDIITGIDNSKVETIDDLISVLRYKKIGQEINLKVQVKEDGVFVERILIVTLGKHQ